MNSSIINETSTYRSIDKMDDLTAPSPYILSNGVIPNGTDLPMSIPTATRSAKGSTTELATESVTGSVPRVNISVSLSRSGVYSVEIDKSLPSSPSAQSASAVSPTCPSPSAGLAGIGKNRYANNTTSNTDILINTTRTYTGGDDTDPSLNSKQGKQQQQLNQNRRRTPPSPNTALKGRDNFDNNISKDNLSMSSSLYDTLEDSPEQTMAYLAWHRMYGRNNNNNNNNSSSSSNKNVQKKINENTIPSTSDSTKEFNATSFSAQSKQQKANQKLSPRVIVDSRRASKSLPPEGLLHTEQRISQQHLAPSKHEVDIDVVGENETTYNPHNYHNQKLNYFIPNSSNPNRTTQLPPPTGTPQTLAVAQANAIKVMKNKEKENKNENKTIFSSSTFLPSVGNPTDIPVIPKPHHSAIIIDGKRKNIIPPRPSGPPPTFLRLKQKQAPQNMIVGQQQHSLSNRPSFPYVSSSLTNSGIGGGSSFHSITPNHFDVANTLNMSQQRGKKTPPPQQRKNYHVVDKEVLPSIIAKTDNCAIKNSGERFDENEILPFNEKFARTLENFNYENGVVFNNSNGNSKSGTGTSPYLSKVNTSSSPPSPTRNNIINVDHLYPTPYPVPQDYITYQQRNEISRDAYKINARNEQLSSTNTSGSNSKVNVNTNGPKTSIPQNNSANFINVQQNSSINTQQLKKENYRMLHVTGQQINSTKGDKGKNHFPSSNIVDDNNLGIEKENSINASIFEASLLTSESFYGNDMYVQSQQTLEVPRVWCEYWDEEVEAFYYYNQITGEATWIKPEENPLLPLDFSTSA